MAGPRVQLETFPLYPNEFPMLAIGNVTTGAAGGPASAAVVIRNGEQQLDLLLPQADISVAAMKANNLGDLTNYGLARQNLGLGSLALQAATAVAILGGAADGVTIGGTTPAAGTFTTLQQTQGFNKFTANPTFTEALGVLGRGLIFDSGTFANPGVVMVPAGKQLNVIGWRENTINLGAGASSQFIDAELFYNGADGASNGYGGLFSVHGASGTGAVKAVYGRATAEVGYTGAVVAFVGGVTTRSTVNTSYGLQLNNVSPDGTPVTAGIVMGANPGSLNGLNPMRYGLLFDATTQFVAGGAMIQGSGGGAGNCLSWLNAAGTAVLASIDNNGNGVFNSLAVPAQGSISLPNGNRTFQLQGLTSGDRMALTVGGVGVVFAADSHLNISLGGSTAPSTAAGALAMVNGQLPSAAMSNGGVLAVVGGALKFIGGNGTVTTIANA